MPNILVISRNFPPLGSVGGSIRLVKLIKYLSKKNWEFTIITQDQKCPSVSEKDHSEILEGELPAELRIFHKEAFISVSDRLSDTSILKNIAALSWGIRAIQNGYQLLQKENFDLVYASMPFFVNGFIAALLSRFANKPFVLDMKDDYVGSSLHLSKGSLRKAIERRLENFVIQSASKVTFATEHSLTVYRDRYPGRLNDFHSIPNGCDLDEFEAEIQQILPIPQDNFIILSAASRYRKDYRDALPFLKAFSQFIQDNPDAADNVRVVFLGESLSDDYQKDTEELGISKIIDNLTTADREKYRAWLVRANLFFLVQPYGNTTSTSGTLYEYWATGGAPVLLFSEEGASRSLVRQYQLGQGFDFNAIQEASNYIEKVYRNARLNQPILISKNGIEAFDRKHLAYEMENVWITAIQSRNRDN